MMMDRPSLAIHPRLAKSINALFTVSREDPTSCAISSCVSPLRLRSALTYPEKKLLRIVMPD